ncbi:MAG: hypothetical protein R3281_13965, partial [Balneolaceae bacterium]|nr:hypothetical protein [Balneolaceae bacterium]
MNDKYERIRTPWKQRLRELQFRGVPVLVFLAVSAVVFYLWNQRVHAPDFVGKVVGKKTVITAPERGRWMNFRYSRFDRVDKGDLLGEIVTTDTSLVDAWLGVIRQ